MSPVFFTIATRNYFHYARALAASLKQHHGETERVLAVVDAQSDTIDLADLPEFDRVIGFDQLGLPSPEAFSFRYDAMELSTAVKPFLFSKLLAEGYDRLVYLDPDIQVYRPLTEVFTILDNGASTVLTPHSLSPVLHNQRPNDKTFLQCGAYNLGFMALADTPQTRAALQWWQTCTEHGCVSNRLSEGLFADQKYIDLWPSYCADTHILRDPSYNVAYWNLDTRDIVAVDGGYQVAGRPLAFFHFSGIVPGDRTILSRHQTRWTVDSSPALRQIFDAYHDALDRYGRERWSQVPYGFGAFRDGTPIPKLARIYFRDELEPFAENPFDVLPRWLKAPAATNPHPSSIVTQLMHRLWKERTDLQVSFHLRDTTSQMQYAEWYVSRGAAEADIPPAFVRGPREALRTLQEARDEAAKRPFRTLLARSVFTSLVRIAPQIKFLYRYIPARQRRGFLYGMQRTGWAGESPAVSEASLAPGLSLIGYPFAEMGLGAAMRSLARSVTTTQVPFDVVSFDLGTRHRHDDRTLVPFLAPRPQRRVNVFCVNADVIGFTMGSLGHAATASRYNIIRPFWELPRLHPQWSDALSHVDEVWAPTHFVKQAFLAAGIERVTHIPVAVEAPVGILPRREQFGIPADATAFLFAFDFSSYPARKNPQAVLEAYRRAFGEEPKARVALVIKTMGESPLKQQVFADLAKAAHQDGRIIIIDQVLTRRDMHALTASADVFVSLHRSEGFGLGIAEAMAMGKPVIVTDYSGSTDFVTAETGFPIPHRLVEVRPDDYPYFVEGQHWAEPDVEAAAKVMRSLADDRALRQDMGARAQRFMAAVHSPAAVGAIIASRLAELRLQ